MTHILILLFVLGGAALYFMKPDERDRVLRVVLAILQEMKSAITLEDLQSDPLIDALRARTRRVIVAPSIIALTTVASFGNWIGLSARTTNGEWPHVLSNMFVEPGLLALVVNGVCLLQISLILERLLGRLAFSMVYISAGLAAGIVSFFVSPDGVGSGAFPSVYALYAVLLVTSTWNFLQRSRLAIPLNLIVKAIGPAAAVFALYHLAATGLFSGAALAALVAGLAGGIVIARDLDDDVPQIRRLSMAMAAVVAFVAVGSVIALHRTAPQITDVRPEIERVIAVEHRTSSLYDEAVERFKKGRINAAALADVIDLVIVPELREVMGRLTALRGVPPEHQQLVGAAEEFLKLRDESWQLRAAALSNGDMIGLREADKKEQVSLETFRRVKTPRTAGGG